MGKRGVRGFRRGIGLCFLLGVMAAPGAGHARTDLAAELKDAQAALAAGNYDKAYPQYQRYAEQEDNALAQFTLGMFHQLGWGSRPVDRPAACGWFERSAAGGIPAAAHFLAECFERGIGRPADPALAAKWYRRAAELGHYISLCALAELHMAGNGVDRDPAKAVALCREAAEKGATAARLQVGRYLLEGDDGIRDAQAAHAWFESAAGAFPEAEFYLGVMARDGLGRERNFAEARAWFERASSRGYVPAYFQTAKLYFEVSPDYRSQPPPADDLAKAYMWLTATLQRSIDAEEQDRAREMLMQVREIMPATWAPTLDERVAAHLSEHGSSN